MQPPPPPGWFFGMPPPGIPPLLPTVLKAPPAPIVVTPPTVPWPAELEARIESAHQETVAKLRQPEWAHDQVEALKQRISTAKAELKALEDQPSADWDYAELEAKRTTIKQLSAQFSDSTTYNAYLARQYQRNMKHERRHKKRMREKMEEKTSDVLARLEEAWIQGQAKQSDSFQSDQEQAMELRRKKQEEHEKRGEIMKITKLLQLRRLRIQKAASSYHHAAEHNPQVDTTLEEIQARVAGDAAAKEETKQETPSNDPWAQYMIPTQGAHSEPKYQEASSAWNEWLVKSD